ncbi:hypothetical protein [Malaciobacter marinus]|uniref:hypothetical protein n=1 Tax=Malaciobacter marinus TaxID=505249 RepID=UPI003B001456
MGFLLFSPIFIYQGSKVIKELTFEIIEKNYKNKQFITDFSKTKYIYSDFITYKNEEYKSESINIDKFGNRLTIQSKNLNNKSPYYIFFGPSIIWGDGESDSKTIPSIFSQKNKVYTENKAVNGYVSRQSLAKLNNYYIYNSFLSKKRVIIFNDGAIDFYTSRDNDKVLKTAHTERIKEDLKTEYLEFNLLIKPISYFLRKFKNKFYSKKEETEKLTNEKIEFIANTIVEAWKIANSIVESNGDSFFAVLTPFSYEDSLNVPLNGVYITKEQKEAIKKGYELIRKKIKRYPNIKFIDLSKIFKNNEKAYLDPMHYSYEGKIIFVEKLTNEIKKFKDINEKVFD